MLSKLATESISAKARPTEAMVVGFLRIELFLERQRAHRPQNRTAASAGNYVADGITVIAWERS
jgi:hypothetical protein